MTGLLATEANARLVEHFIARSESAVASDPHALPADALLQFCRRSSVPRWVDGPHLDLITRTMQEAIVRAALGDGIDVMFFAPPRHGKSHTISVLAPVWALGMFPGFSVILTSYGAKLATSKSREAREVMRRVTSKSASMIGSGQFEVMLDEESASKSDWRLVAGRGRMLAAGVRGPLTGEGAKLGIIDDPFKDWRDAHSSIIREAVWDWYRTVFSTRIEPGGSKVIQLTRWHHDDLAGRALEEQGRVEEGGRWRVVVLPALIETSEDERVDALKRKRDGPSLWPVRWSKEALLDKQADLGPYAWSALFQQRPQAQGGRLFKRKSFRYYDRRMLTEGDAEVEVFELHFGDGETERVRAAQCVHFWTIDTALKTKQTSDYFVAEHWWLTPPVRGARRRLLADVVRDRFETPDQVPLIGRLWKQSGAAFMGVEESVAGLSAMQYSVRAGVPIRPCTPDVDKVARALPLTAAYESELIFHRRDAGWAPVFEDELVEFPHAAHDDQVDAAAYAEVFVREIEARPTVKVWVPGVNVRGKGGRPPPRRRGY